ncbi:uncharacterized protein DS421_18g611750 [Arachis hypogaea]|nr:uncharacterized protein DS421_18g611750 [Arachis hypogaea]
MVVVVVEDLDQFLRNITIQFSVGTTAIVGKKLRRLPHVFSCVLELLFGPTLMFPSRRSPITFALSLRLKRLEAAAAATPRYRRVPARETCVREWMMLYGELEVFEVAEEEYGDDEEGVKNEGCECDGKGHEKEGFECGGGGGI